MAMIKIKLKGRPSFLVEESEAGKYLNASTSDIPPPVTEDKKYSESELYAMTKGEQIALLKKLGSRSYPSIEAARVNKLLDMGAGK